MNLPLARQYIEMAIAQRDAARALAYTAPHTAANCRAQMRLHAEVLDRALGVSATPLPTTGKPKEGPDLP